MAHLINLHADVLNDVAEQIGNFPSLENHELDNLELAEYFPMWNLTNGIFEPANRYYFQVVSDNIPCGYAEAISNTVDSTLQVVSLWVSSIAKDIDIVINLIDKSNVMGEARLIMIPYKQAHIIWIANSNSELDTFVIITNSISRILTKIAFFNTINNIRNVSGLIID